MSNLCLPAQPKTSAQVGALFQIAADNPALKAKLEQANTDEGFYQTAAKLGEQAGFSFVASDVEAFLKQKLEAQTSLSYPDENLDVVAGSTMMACCGPNTLTVQILTRQCWASLC